MNSVLAWWWLEELNLRARARERRKLTKSCDSVLAFSWTFFHVAKFHRISFTRASWIDHTRTTTWFLTVPKSYPGSSSTRGAAIVPLTPHRPLSHHLITWHIVTLLYFCFSFSKIGYCATTSSPHLDSSSARRGTSRPFAPFHQRRWKVELRREFNFWFVWRKKGGKLFGFSLQDRVTNSLRKGQIHKKMTWRLPWLTLTALMGFQYSKVVFSFPDISKDW